ncbi:MAG: lytic transglycosylase domain-containing protein [Bryobacteraceae bacterium]
MKVLRLTIPALLLGASLPGAQKTVPQPEINSFAAQLASVRQQVLSIDVQRKVVAKQDAAFHRALNQDKSVSDSLRTEAMNLDCGALAPRETERLVQTAARTQSVSPDLLRAVIRQESAFRPCAISEKGAQGLMQLMPATAAAFNVSDPFDPQQNILGGAAYLRQLMQRYGGDASLALSAYNAGPQLVDRIAGIPDIPETQNYVTSIFRDMGWTLPTRQAVAPEVEREQVGADAAAMPEIMDSGAIYSEPVPEYNNADLTTVQPILTLPLAP